MEIPGARHVCKALGLLLLIAGPQIGSADSINSPNITMNVDLNRVTGSGNGAGNESIMVNAITLAELRLDEFSAGANSRIVLAARPGYQFDPTSAVTAQSVSLGINGGAIGAAATLTPTGAADEQLIFNLTSAAANGDNVQDIIRFTGVRVRILNAIGAAGPAQVTLSMTTTAAGGSFEDQGIVAANITRGAPDRLRFSLQPGDIQAGTDLLPAVQIVDFGGNVILNDERTITLELLENPGGAALLGNAVRTTAGGIAVWEAGDDLHLNVAASGYTLRATHDGAPFLTSDVAQSDPFNIESGPPGSLEITTQPADTSAGDDILIVVTARDEFGNPASAPIDVTIDAAVNPAAWPLLVDTSLTKTTVNGVASWGAADNLRINKAVEGYRLAASGLGAPAFSNVFNILAGPAAALRYVQQPTDAQQGVSVDPPVSVETIDALGNRADSNASVQLRLIAGACGGSVTGNAVSAVDGLATFGTLRLDTPCNDVVLQADSPGLIGSVSNTFDVQPGPQVATSMAFTMQPENSAAGAPLLVDVTVLDQFGLPFTAASVAVTLRLSSNPGNTDLLVDSTLTKQTVAGVASWNAADALRITKVGAAYELAASGVGADVVSESFDITAGGPSQLRFTQQPTSVNAGQLMMPPVTVEVHDAFDNPVKEGTQVKLELLSACGGELLNGSAPTSAGLATFAGLVIDEPCDGVTLQAQVQGATSVQSEPFDVLDDTPDAPPACGACGAGGAFAFAPLFVAFAAAKLPKFRRRK